MGKKNGWWSNLPKSPNCEPQHKERGLSNKGTFESAEFKAACEAVGVPVTKRQASKFRNQKGCAYNKVQFIPKATSKW